MGSGWYGWCAAVPSGVTAGWWREAAKGGQGRDGGGAGGSRSATAADERGAEETVADERGGEETAAGERGSETVVRAGGGRLRGGGGRSRISERILF